MYELARFVATQYGEAYSALFSISQHIATGNIDAIKQDLETLLAHTESQYAELQEAFALLQDIVTDEPLRDALLGFPERWLNAQSALDKERLGDMVAFEIIFAILTTGMGAAAKSKHLVKASETLQQASKLLRRKRLNTQSRDDLKPDSSASASTNLDTQVDTKKLELYDKPKVVPVRSMKQHTPPCFTPGDTSSRTKESQISQLLSSALKQYSI